MSTSVKQEQITVTLMPPVPTQLVLSLARVKLVILVMVSPAKERMIAMSTTQCMVRVHRMLLVLLPSLVSNVLVTLVTLETERLVLISMSVWPRPTTATPTRLVPTPLGPSPVLAIPVTAETELPAALRTIVCT
jgi:hypothetical protein